MSCCSRKGSGTQKWEEEGERWNKQRDKWCSSMKERRGSSWVVKKRGVN